MLIGGKCTSELAHTSLERNEFGSGRNPMTVQEKSFKNLKKGGPGELASTLCIHKTFRGRWTHCTNREDLEKVVLSRLRGMWCPFL